MHTSAIRSVALVTGVVAIVFVTSASAWVSPSKSRSLEELTGIRTSVHTSPAGNQVQTANLDHATYVEGEVLIKYRPTLTFTARKNLMVRLGVQEIRNISGLRVVHVKLPQGQSVEQALQVFAQDSGVEYVQPNFIYKAMAAPTDPLYGQQWGFRNTGQTIAGADWSVNNPGVSGNDMNIEQAWDHITDCSTVVVAVVDTGVNYLHQELAGNLWDGSAAGYPNHGFDFVGNGLPGDTDNDPLPQDVNGHGTHVAATIAATANNGVAGSGVCWQARIMAVRVLSSFGGTTASVTAGVNFAVTQGAHVINMSLGGGGFDQIFSDAITNARTNGIVVVVAAGNDDSDNDVAPTYPCNFTHDNLLCVAALDQAYGRAGFSNYGATSVDVGAPGTNVLSGWPGTSFEDDLTTWTSTASWARVNCEPITGLGLVPMLVNPTNWCANGTYANNENAVSYRVFDMGDPNLRAVNYEFWSRLNLQANDYIGIASKSTGGDPFSVGGLLITEISNPDTFWFMSLTDTGTCFTSNCSVGIRLRSDATTVARGAGFFWVTVNTLLANSTHTYVVSGTSMASPHTAGVAAMLRAFNPSFAYGDTIDAIKNGGRSVPALSGVTVTGRAVDAFGALSYIKAPTGINAVVQ